MYNWTDEQELIFDTLTEKVKSLNNNNKTEIISIEAVAGSSKSTSLVESANRMLKENNKLNIRYIVFGSANAKEAKEKFDSRVIVSTTNSLAYNITKRDYDINTDIRPFITWKDIPKKLKIPYWDIYTALNIVNEYLSSSGSLEDAIETIRLKDIYIKPSTEKAANNILEAMHNKEMPITHSYYLKLFHSEMLQGTLNLPEVDVLMLDEVNDVTEQTLDIFKMYPAKLKIMVGDSHQAIHKWMGCVNAFKLITPDTTLHLSQSFRVSDKIAPRIEYFCKRYLNPNFDFLGFTYNNNMLPQTHAYISRTNSNMLDTMIQLHMTNTPYKLATREKLKQLFDIPLAILAAPGFKQKNPTLKHIQEVIDNWSKLSEHNRPSKFKAIMEEFKDDMNITSAIKVIIKYGPTEVINIINNASKIIRDDATITLLTAHTSKGLTFDEVTITDEMNESIEEILLLKDIYIAKGNFPVLTNEEEEALNLYYVACSRCRLKLNNAKHL